MMNWLDERNKNELKKYLLLIDIVSILFAFILSFCFAAFCFSRDMMIFFSDSQFIFFPLVVFPGFIISYSISFFVFYPLEKNIKNKLNSIFFEEGRKFNYYNENGININISKDAGWICCKNSDFVKDDFLIKISSCEIIK